MSVLQRPWRLTRKVQAIRLSPKTQGARSQQAQEQARNVQGSRLRRLALYLDLLPLLAVAVMLGWMAVHAGKAGAQSPSSQNVAITFYYATGNATYSGEWPYEGSAGCSFDFPLGTMFTLPDGKAVRCNDRGADGFMGSHIDIYCPHSFSACLAMYPYSGNWTVPVAVVVARGG